MYTNLRLFCNCFIAVKEKNTNLKFFLLVNTSLKGVYRSKMKTQGWLMGNTTYFVFKNVVVNKSYNVLLLRITFIFINLLRN